MPAAIARSASAHRSAPPRIPRPRRRLAAAHPRASDRFAGSSRDAGVVAGGVRSSAARPAGRARHRPIERCSPRHVRFRVAATLRECRISSPAHQRGGILAISSRWPRKAPAFRSRARSSSHWRRARLTGQAVVRWCGPLRQRGQPSRLAGRPICCPTLRRGADSRARAPRRLTAGHLRLAKLVSSVWGLFAVFAGRLLQSSVPISRFRQASRASRSCPSRWRTIVGAIPGISPSPRGFPLGQNYERGGQRARSVHHSACRPGARGDRRRLLLWAPHRRS